MLILSVESLGALQKFGEQAIDGNNKTFLVHPAKIALQFAAKIRVSLGFALGGMLERRFGFWNVGLAEPFNLRKLLFCSTLQFRKSLTDGVGFGFFGVKVFFGGFQHSVQCRRRLRGVWMLETAAQRTRLIVNELQAQLFEICGGGEHLFIVIVIESIVLNFKAFGFGFKADYQRIVGGDGILQLLQLLTECIEIFGAATYVLKNFLNPANIFAEF